MNDFDAVFAAIAVLEVRMLTICLSKTSIIFQQCIQKLTMAVVHKKLSIVVVHTKIIKCKSASKSCPLQVVHTKAFSALAQFCDFLCLFY